MSGKQILIEQISDTHKRVHFGSDFIDVNEVQINELYKVLQQFNSTKDSGGLEILPENIIEIIKSDSVYTSLRRAFKSPSSTGVDECEDNFYIDLYNLSVALRTPPQTQETKQ